MSRDPDLDEFDLDDLDHVDAADYLRVSRDRSGVLRSTTEQHDENLVLCGRKRWTLARSYTDEGSASEFQRKRRPDFDALLNDLRGDTFAARVLIVWEVSRGTRRAGEMEMLLDLCRKRGVWIYVYNKRRLFNPHVVDDWEDLMHAAVSAAGESMRTSQRTRRASKADAKAGNFKGGRRPYGYGPNGVDVVPAEQAVIRAAVDRVLAGQSVRSIAVGLNKAGMLTSVGNQWHPGPLANLLGSPRIAGQRVHRGEVIGPAVWPAIITMDEHRRVVAALASRTPTGRRGPTPWLLTGILRCGLCSNHLSSNSDAGTGTRRYFCRKAPGYHGCGGLGIKAEPLEEILGILVAERLVDVDARRDAGPGNEDDSEELAELDSIAAMRIELADDYAAKRISRQTRIEDAAALDRRQRVVEAALAAKVRTVAPFDFVAAEGFVGRPWASLDVEDQRVVLTALVDHVTVAPASLRGSTKFEAARVTAPGRIVWKI